MNPVSGAERSNGPTGEAESRRPQHGKWALIGVLGAAVYAVAALLDSRLTADSGISQIGSRPVWLALTSVVFGSLLYMLLKGQAAAKHGSRRWSWREVVMVAALAGCAQLVGIDLNAPADGLAEMAIFVPLFVVVVLLVSRSSPQ